MKIDRDLNAALNLVTVSLPETQTACREDVRRYSESFEIGINADLDEAGTEHQSKTLMSRIV
ncbi:MAG: hypothetical protein ACTSV2_11310 [Candidatus Thorarchaeota archaeon]